MYADSEALKVKINTCKSNPEQSYTQKLHKQVPSSFCFYVVSSITSEQFEPVTYTTTGGQDIGQIFSEKLIEYAPMIYDKY